MKKLVSLFLIFLSSFLALPQTLAEENNGSQNWVLWEWYYYLDEDTHVQQVEDFLCWIQQNPPKDTDLCVIAIRSAFVSVIFDDNPFKIKTQLKNIQFIGVARDILERALWLSGNVKIIKKTFKTIPGYAKLPATNLLEIKITKSSDLSLMWGEFYASGNDAYVEKTITVALDQKQHNDLRQFAIAILGDIALADLKIRRILIKHLKKYQAESSKSPPLLTNYTHPKRYALFMFGAFLITGEDEYLQKIIDIIDGTKNFQNQKIVQETKE